ncbi:solute carrier family 25 member 45 isoform X3 [Otolemur garnettii]|uniref:solute carrier family 25 member 45 isoform X3 n=1 Tax=Otolemur garnettii TaxID=30611 RepID=UPI00064433E4|nr:solute carrier family 25 member 45 isoform X3 [Otolemur garnettii]
MPVEEFVAGWISGALGLVLGHPFDTVKVRLQTQTTYQGITDCMVKIYRHESILGFFKGMSFPIASIAVVNSVLFGVYSNSLLALTATSHRERRAQPPSYTHVFIAGCAGGFMQAYCLAPFDLIKVRLQNQTEPRAKPGSPPPRYRGPVHCATSIFQKEGPRGLFRGAWALTLRDTPTLGIYFVTYEALCRQGTPEGQNPMCKPVQHRNSRLDIAAMASEHSWASGQLEGSKWYACGSYKWGKKGAGSQSGPLYFAIS